MPGAAVLVPDIGVRDLASVVTLRFTAAVWFVCPTNGHASTPANKKRIRFWYLILPPLLRRIFLADLFSGRRNRHTSDYRRKT
jgi:hypothetical protein